MDARRLAEWRERVCHQLARYDEQDELDHRYGVKGGSTDRLVDADRYRKCRGMLVEVMELLAETTTAETLAVDQNAARALHRVVRAMHDGECPKCHTVHAAAAMLARHPEFHGWQCPSCGFRISTAEGEAVFQAFAPFMERNLDLFETWRSQRGQKERSCETESV